MTLMMLLIFAAGLVAGSALGALALGVWLYWGLFEHVFGPLDCNGRRS